MSVRPLGSADRSLGRFALRSDPAGIGFVAAGIWLLGSTSYVVSAGAVAFTGRHTRA